VNAALDWLGGALVLLGSLFVFVGGVGAIRLPDVFTRIHAAGITDTMGTLLVLAGCALHVGTALAVVKVAAILVFLLLTGPTATYALANAARLGGVLAPYMPEPRAEHDGP
jgi:multicomponent Na+:H+ antiporter subunit G